MKKHLLPFLLLTLLLAACAPGALPTEQPSYPNDEPGSYPNPDESSYPVPTDLTPAQQAAITALSQSLNLPPGKITLISTEAEEWPDGCLGIQREGVMCTQAIVPCYKVMLQVNGTLDRATSRITSDPPLTSAQIASLLTGGDEEAVANIGGSVNDLQTLGAGGLSSFATTLLDDNVTGRVAQGFGLSRLSIDPGKGLLSRTGGSRLTVGKRVTSDIEFIYSRNIFGGTDSQLATAEYSLSNRFSLVASWEQPGGFGADVRTRITLDR